MINIGGEIMNREDFPILKKDIIYFDNGATTLKPKVLCESLNDYYNELTKLQAEYNANKNNKNLTEKQIAQINTDIKIKIDIIFFSKCRWNRIIFLRLYRRGF